MSDDDEQAPYVPNVPVTFKVNGQTMPTATTSLVKEPTPGEVSLFSSSRVKTCGDCKSFQKDEKTDRLIASNDLLRKLKYDYKWSSRYLPGKFNELGICRQKNDTVVGPQSRGCEYYKLKA